MAGSDDEIDAADEDHDNEDEDPTDPKKTDDEDTDTQFDAQLFKEQVVNLQQKAGSRFSTLPHRDTRLLNRSEKRTT